MISKNSAANRSFSGSPALAEEYLAKTKVAQGLFLVLVGRSPGVVWTVGAHHHIERKTPAPYSSTIPLTFWIPTGPSDDQDQRPSSLPPVQVILNGHEYAACQARRAGILFTKEGNCFTTISDTAALAKIADALSEPRAVGG
jgi:hypothetical protein